MNIIIFGQAGAGKSTIADMFASCGYVRYSLGKKIHAECALHGSEKREEMQQYGQAMREIFGIDVWNDYTYSQLSRVMFYGRAIIDDGRQLNEFQYWTRKGFITIGVKADFEVRKLRIWKRDGKVLTEEHTKHETEIQASMCVEKCDINIENNGTLEALKKQIANLT